MDWALKVKVLQGMDCAERNKEQLCMDWAERVKEQLYGWIVSKGLKSS